MDDVVVRVYFQDTVRTSIRRLEALHPHYSASLSLSFFSSHGLKHGICPCNEGRRSNSMYELFDAPCLSLLQTDGLELNPRSTSMLRPCESVHGLNAG